MSGLALLAAVLALTLVHLFAYRLRFLDGIPRSRWLSLAGGVSVAYVFIHLLPELDEGQRTIEGAIPEGFSFVEHHAYLVALAGLVAFYGLERAAKVSRRRRSEAGEGDRASPGVFWLHITSFGIYNAIIGYLLFHRENPGPVGLALFVVAMGLHFLVTDYGLRKQHHEAYVRIGRWLLALAIPLGAGVGLAVQASDLALAVLRAFLAGGVILNVLKEELPDERQSRFGAFALGVAGYATILLAL